MNRIAVLDANRKIKRDIQKVFGDNFLKIITEIILNSDDSYNRIIDKNSQLQYPITLWLNRKNRTMRFLDQAEGMSFERMRDIFSRYGGDYSGSTIEKNVRGLFGQGASDVLFLSAFYKFESFIISIKDGQTSKCQFFFDDKKEITVSEIKDDINLIRKNTGIENNGTYVEFGIPESVKIPKRNEIKSIIESFYMLRYILSDKHKQVAIYDGDLKHRLTSNRYLPNEKKVILKKRAIKLNFDGVDIKSTLMLYEKKPSESQQIIIRDDNYIVYDETLFGLEKVHGANYIAGEFTIEGIYNILRDKLNADNPEEILRDSRDGFDKRHRFTIEMYDKVSQILYKLIEDLNSARESVSLSLNNNKKLFNALKKINSYFNDLELSSIAGINLGNNPPIEGIRFARPSISITKGKLYGLHIYINSEMIEPNKNIQIVTEENQYITILSNNISYSEKDMRDTNLIIKTMIIKAEKITTKPVIVKAVYDNYETSVLINVVNEKVIYPENGLEFKPKRKEVLPGKNTSFILYFDTEYIPLGSTIRTTTVYESMLFPIEKEYTILESHIVANTIGRIKINFISHDYDEKITITALYNSISANAVCYVKDKKKDDDGSEGLLNKLELVFDPESNSQATVIPSKGILQINGSHIINKTIMGNLGNKEAKNPDFDQKQLRYLYELVSLESSKLYVSEKSKKSQINYDIEEFYNEIQNHKTKIYSGLIE